MNRQNWNKRKSLSKAVHKAGQQQQEHYIHYVQETLWASEPFQGRPPEVGEGERERMVPGEWNGQWTQGWSLLHELHEWRKQQSPEGQRHWPLFHELQYGGQALLPQEVVTSRGEPEDNGSVEWGAGENCRSRFILDQSDAPVAAASLQKAMSYSSHEWPGEWRAVWMISNLYLVRSDQRWGWEAQITIWCM